MKCNNPTNQNAINAENRRRIKEVIGFEPDAAFLGKFTAWPADMQEQWLMVMRATVEALHKNGYPPASQRASTLSAHSSDALINLTNQLTKAKELADRIEQCERGLGEIEAKLKAANMSWVQERQKEDAGLDELRKAADELHDKVDKKITEEETTIEKFSMECQASAVNALKKFVDENKGECEELKRKLKDLLARTTVATLSSKFEEKRKSLWKTYLFEKGLFFLCLMLFCILGLAAVSSAGELGSADIFGKVFKSILKHVPFGLPLFWLTCHINRLMNQNRRLMEEYTHKVVVSQTYIGMANQVEELAKKGVESAKELTGWLIDGPCRL